VSFEFPLQIQCQLYHCLSEQLVTGMHRVDRRQGRGSSRCRPDSSACILRCLNAIFDPVTALPSSAPACRWRTCRTPAAARAGPSGRLAEAQTQIPRDLQRPGFPSFRRAFVPLAHLSDTGGRKGKAKWAVGGKAQARILEADAAARRLTATLKKALVTSKLPLIVHLQVCILFCN